eukprot:SAG31_NODE_4173_length_3509_cov_58.704985_1_plen_262_part_00
MPLALSILDCPLALACDTCTRAPSYLLHADHRRAAPRARAYIQTEPGGAPSPSFPHCRMHRLQRTHTCLLASEASASAAENHGRYITAAAELNTLGVKVVCWDMDQTMVAAHSHGTMTKASVDEFAAAVSEDFLGLSPALAEVGIRQAVTTHSDRAEHSSTNPPSTHLLGEDLAAAVLSRSTLPYELTKTILLIGYNPEVRSASGDADAGLVKNQAKKYHVRMAARHYGVSVSECLLLDDVRSNVEDTEGCLTALVDERYG